MCIFLKYRKNEELYTYFPEFINIKVLVDKSLTLLTSLKSNIYQQDLHILLTKKGIHSLLQM